MAHSAPTLRLRAAAGALPGIVSLGTAVPPLRLTQAEALGFILESFAIRESTKTLYRRVMANPAIQTRHFALDALADVLDKNHERVAARHADWAVRLGTQALHDALRAAGIESAALDFLAVTTCTGYSCPGLSAHLVESAGLRGDIQCVDIAGMGCGAAVPALNQAAQFLRAHPEGTAAVVSVEICSAAMFSDDAADLVISNALFADGAAAAILRTSKSGGHPNPGEGPGAVSSPPARLIDFASLTLPEWRETLRFRTDGGHLRNVLGKAVPAQAGEAVKRVSDSLLARHGLAAGDVDHWILHSGGEKILDAIESALGLPAESTAASRRVLRDFGNMSSPTVLFVLQEQRARGVEPGALAVLASFGAGFSAHAVLLEF